MPLRNVQRFVARHDTCLGGAHAGFATMATVFCRLLDRGFGCVAEVLEIAGNGWGVRHGQFGDEVSRIFVCRVPSNGHNTDRPIVALCVLGEAAGAP